MAGSDINDLAVRLIDAGLHRHAERLTSLALPCLRLRVTDVDTGDWPTGTSKLGGTPDVPADFEWPDWRDLPLAFLGQVNLADMGRVRATPELPSAGMLSFFYHPEQSAWGFDPEDAGSARVYWFPNVHELRRTPVPDHLPSHGRFEAGRVTFRKTLSLPPYQALDVQALRMSAEEDDAYFGLREEWQVESGDGPQHQLLGHPSPVQDEMQLECQLVSHGIYCGGPDAYRHPRRAEIEAGARDWRLLAQIDSDDEVGMMWGDAGMLYFWIREADIAERRFDRSWMILQCS